jgi:TPR repeat protein
LQHTANGDVATEKKEVVHALEFYKQADKEYKNVATQGDKRAQYLLGALYAKGLGLRGRENEAAVSFLTKATEQGVKEAVPILEKIATEGDANASFALKKIYARGISVARDPRASFKWLAKAAQQEHARAQFELSEIYAESTKTGDDKLAVEWLRKAAKNKHKGALMKIKGAPPLADLEVAATIPRVDEPDEGTMIRNSQKENKGDNDTMESSAVSEDSEPSFED